MRQVINTDIYKTITIKEIKEGPKNFKTFSFEEEPSIAYLPGQYLTLVDAVHEEEVRRSYSITSSPFLGEPLTIGVKRIENGYFSRKLVDGAKVGDQLLTIGAGGFFTFPNDLSSYHQIFFLAAGSGITPIFSLLKTALFGHPHLKVVLIYSSPSAERTAFREQLQQLEQGFSNQLKIEFLFSNTPDLSRAHLYRDLLIQLLHQYAVADTNNILFYTCGPEAYMRMCTYVLQQEGVLPQNIRRENFVIQRLPPPEAEPPDKGKHFVTIKFHKKEYHFPVRYPQTILSAAKGEGIVLPYSCEVGRCGNCVARCTKGTVWLSYNEVLTQNELGKGLTLTCVGYPVGGDVLLEIGR